MKWLVISVILFEIIQFSSTQQRLELYAIEKDEKKKLEWCKNNLLYALTQVVYLFASIFLLSTKRWEPAVVVALGLISGVLKLGQKFGRPWLYTDSAISLAIWYHLMLAM